MNAPGSAYPLVLMILQSGQLDTQDIPSDLHFSCFLLPWVPQAHEPGALLEALVAGLLGLEVQISEVVCGEVGGIGKRHASRQNNSLTHLTMFSCLEQSYT